MSRPNRYVFLMLLCIVAVAGLAYMLRDRLFETFQHNPGLNSGILAVLCLGILFAFFQVFRLYPEIAWIDQYRRGGQELSGTRAPRLLGPMAAMLGERRGRLNLSTLSLRSLLDGINARLAESHEISRYLIALMVFLGLLGTFWGLLGTISSVGAAVSNLSVGTGDPAALFTQLKNGLTAPLTGMGTAFGASLLGLSGSLVLGFLDLQAGQAHNRFFNELEDWLASQTRLTPAGIATEGGDTNVPAYLQALLDQTSEHLEQLNHTLVVSDESRTMTNNRLEVLNDRLEALVNRMTNDQQTLLRVAETQTELRPFLAKLVDVAEQDGFGIDETSRRHLRSIDDKIGQLQFRTAGPGGAGAMVPASMVGGGSDPALARQIVSSFEAFNTYLANHQQLLLRISDSQADMVQFVARLAEMADRGGVGLDERTRQHIRSIDGQLGRLQEQSVPAHIQALLVQTAESLDNLQRSVVGGEELRMQSEQRMVRLNESMAQLAGSLASDHSPLARIAEAQEQLRSLIGRLAEATERGGAAAGGGLDEMTRHHIRNIDAYLSRLLEELSVGRQYTVQELRNEIKMLARTITAIAEESGR
ncbi:MAG: hypothetical protein U1E53_26440 [Dongiaceae bacterium]